MTAPATASFFTIVTPSHAAQARVLVRSINRFHPEDRVTVAIVGEAIPDGLFADLGCETVAVARLGIGHYYDMAARYSTAQLCYALKPILARLLTARDRVPAIYLDADMEVLAPLGSVQDALRAGASLVLTPHLLRPSTGAHFVDDATLLRNGTFNAGFFAAAPSADAALAWWQERTATQCLVDDARGLFDDQKWLDLADRFFPGVHVLRDPACNVAYWNLHERDLSIREGRLFAGERPVALMHYSQWQVLAAPMEVYSERYIQDGRAAAWVAPTLEAYAAKVSAERFHVGEDTSCLAPDYATLPDGTPITPLMRRVYRRHVPPQSGGWDEVADLFARILDEPSPRLPRSETLHFTQAYEELWASRPDLYIRIDVGSLEGIRAAVAWLANQTAVHDLPDPLLARARAMMAALAREESERGAAQDPAPAEPEQAAPDVAEAALDRGRTSGSLAHDTPPAPRLPGSGPAGSGTPWPLRAWRRLMRS